MAQRTSVPPRVRFYRPRGVLSGFDATAPDPKVPEVRYAGEQWLPMEYAIGRHAHEVYEFYYQIDGVSLWQSQGRRYELRAKQFFLAPPAVEHLLVNRPTGKHHFFFAQLDVKAVFRRVPEVAEQFRSDACRIVTRAETLEAPFRQFMREVTTRSPYRTQGLRTAVDQLVIEAARLLSGKSVESLVAVHPGVKVVLEAFERQPGEHWTLPQLGKLAALSPNHLTELFKEEMGLAPHQYLLKERIRRAKEMLGGSDTPITQLSIDLGFASSQHFAKMFRQATKTTALDYRKRAQAKHARQRISRAAP